MVDSVGDCKPISDLFFITPELGTSLIAGVAEADEVMCAMEGPSKFASFS